MNETLVLDTQSLVWFLEGNVKLSAAARPAIALTEACWMSQKTRTPLTIAEIRTAIDADSRLHVEPLQEEIIFNAADISALADIHDCLIVATALYLAGGGAAISLVTADHAIESYVAGIAAPIQGGGSIRTIW